MKKIESFTVNHLDLLRGIYVSRKDNVNENIITTFDIRMKRPNLEPVMNNAEMHTIEHLAATFLRNNEEWKSKVIYFGPMGCRTGFYFICSGEYTPKEILELVKSMFLYIINFEGLVPGQTARDCGNHLDMNLPMAIYESKIFYEEILLIIKDENMNYPE